MKTLRLLQNTVDRGLTIEGSPEIRVYRNAAYIPKQHNFDMMQGIYTETGFLVQEAALYEGEPPRLKGHSQWINIRSHEPLLEFDRAIYIGHADLHYGHTITEFMPRLWALPLIRQQGEKLLLHSFHSDNQIFSTSWFCDLIAIFGLSRDDFIIFRTPTRIRLLTIPGPAFLENNFVYSVFNDYARQRGQNLVAESRNKFPEIIYLSREKNFSHERRYEGEAEVTSHLRRMGVRIVFPEEIPISEQITIFRPGNIVIGTLGSAFHTSIFGRNSHIICISRDDPTNNFWLMDYFGKHTVNYFQVEYEADAAIGIKDNFALPNPEVMAKEIYSLAISQARTLWGHVTANP